ncbi:MAG: M48 family metalloprotease [Bryobacteraceae bacterium]|nr:M48 family metalloprotease [Bryobacteraceae bacterium]
MTRKLAFLLIAAAVLRSAPAADFDSILDRVVAREKEFVQKMAGAEPLVETYVQQWPHEGDGAPYRDEYFLGRLKLAGDVHYAPLVRSEAAGKRRWKWPSRSGFEFLPRGFAQMAVIDAREFNRDTYAFTYARKEFVGRSRCLVFDVAPKQPKAPGKFQGRIWVEEEQFRIIRVNGTYTQRDPRPSGRYFHFEALRQQVMADFWAPALIYIEDSAPGSAREPGFRFKAQTRLWAFGPATASRGGELGEITVASGPVSDASRGRDLSPLAGQREWERQSERNVLDRLEIAGLLGKPGPLEEVLDAVAGVLAAASGTSMEVRCRVLLTTPLESFSIGHTVVLSRGLIDVLPDESALALVIAAELAHIALGHPTPTAFAFHNRMMVSDAELMTELRMARSAPELAAASARAAAILEKSPYPKTGSAGLFLRALASRRASLVRLLSSNLGNQLAGAETRYADLVEQASKLEEGKLDQIAALPLGSRVRVNPWTNETWLAEAKPLSFVNAREKMPFEVAPFPPALAEAGHLPARAPSVN